MNNFKSFSIPELIDAIRHMNQWLKEAVELEDFSAITFYTKSIAAAQTALYWKNGELS